MNTTKHELYAAEQKRLEVGYPILKGSLEAVTTQLEMLTAECRKAQADCDRAMYECDTDKLSQVCAISGACIERFNTLQKHYNGNGFKVLAYRDKFTATPYHVEVCAA